MKAGPEPSLDWQSFMKEPAGYIAPDRFAGVFEGVLPARLCEKMLESPRLRSRLSGLLQGHFQLGQWIDADALDTVDQALVLISVDELSPIARRAGAVFWSSAIAGAVLAKAVAALQEQLGDELCSYAMNQRDLAGPGRNLEPLDTVGDRIEADGWRCIAAWCQTLPAPVAARMKLKFPKDSIFDEPVAPEFEQRGPEIIRRVAAS
jgi:hypothetical protein